MGKFYKLITHHGSILVEDDSAPTVVTVASADLQGGRSALVIYVSGLLSGVCFLLSPSGRRLAISREKYGAGIIPLGLSKTPSSAVISLFDLSTGLWACATPLFGERPPRGTLVFDRRRIDAYEQYTLEAIPEISVPAMAFDVARKLENYLGQPFVDVFDAPVDTSDSAILNAVGQAVGPREIEVLANALFVNPPKMEAVKQIYRDCIWGQAALDDLARLRDTSPARDTPKSYRGLFRKPFANAPRQSIRPPPPSGGEVLNESFDPLGVPGFTGPSSPLPLALVAAARRKIVPRKQICVVATARNEGLYILEWLAYHIAIGVEQVFLYSNDNDDGSDELLEALAAAGAIRWTRNVVGEGGNAQLKAYTHALSIRSDILDYRWAAFIDLDEYIAFNPSIFASFQDWLRWHDLAGAEAIALNWVLYHGHSKAPRWTDSFIGDRFPFQSEMVNPHIKTIFQPRMFIQSTPHHPISYCNAAFSFRYNNGAPYQDSPAGRGLAAEPNADFAWVNHYLYKTAEEFLIKWSRNRGDHPTLKTPNRNLLPSYFVEAFVRQFRPPAERRASLGDCAPALTAELERLRSIPGVKDAWANIQMIYRQRVHTILPMFVDAPGIIEAGAAGQEFLAYLSLAAPAGSHR